MDCIDGRVPPDFPSYHAQGWFAENLDAAGRDRMWWNGIEEMERLHRIDWRAFPFLAPGLEQAPTAVFYPDKFVSHWVDWRAQGPSFPVIEQSSRFHTAIPPQKQRPGIGLCSKQ